MNHYKGRVKFPSDVMFRQYLDYMLKWGEIKPAPPTAPREAPAVVERLQRLHRLHLLGAEITKDDEAFVWEKR